MKNNKCIFVIATLIEIALSIFVIISDFFIPTFILIFLMVLSMIIRKENISTIGLTKPKSWLKLIPTTLGLALFMQFIDAGITMPILYRLTGIRVDYSSFSNLQGNFEQLLFLIAMSWTLAAVGEEIVYRGYLQNQFYKILSPLKNGQCLTIVLSSIMFGLAHREQGLVGVIVTTVNAIFFSLIKNKNNNNIWYSICTHGFYNSVGVIIFYFTGPIYSLW